MGLYAPPSKGRVVNGLSATVGHVNIEDPTPPPSPPRHSRETGVWRKHRIAATSTVCDNHGFEVRDEAKDAPPPRSRAPFLTL